jgi:hypothetical protein
VAAAAVALRALRREIMGKHGCSLRDLYRTLDEPGANPLRDAHARLDTAVRAAYGMNCSHGLVGRRASTADSQGRGQPREPSAHPTPHSGVATADPLAFLLELNQQLAARERAGEPITPPGLPLPEPGRAAFSSEAAS